MSRTRIGTVLVLAMVLTAVLSGGAAAGAPSGGDPPTSTGLEYVDGEVLVGYVAGTTRAEQQRIEAEAGATEQRVVGVGARVLEVGRGNVERTIEQFERNARVRYAHPNYVLHVDATPNDPSFNQLWGLLNTGQTINTLTGTAGADIDAVPAWDRSTGSRDIVVGVVDTGIDYNHPDLAANVWENPGGIGGCAAGTHGYNAINNTCNPADDNNHGTHVAGTIGAVGNNGVGVTGVNWNVSLVGLKFLNSSGSGTTADAVEAINWAIQAKQAGVNLRVLNNSWGGGGFSQALKDAIEAAGANDILFVAAAGNNATNTDVTPHYPSSYGTANELSVAATTQHDALASFSNYGANSVHLGAPGRNVYSTIRGTSYTYLSGTSMATPHVAGVAALALSACTLTTAALKSLILANVDLIPALAGKTTTGGRLNANEVLADCGLPPTPDFSLSLSPASRSLPPNGSTTYTVNVNRTGGFADPVTLSVEALPAGVVGSFEPNPADASSTLTVTTTAALPGTYPLTISGSGGALTRTAAATLVVETPDFSLSVTPGTRTIGPSASTTYSIAVNRTGGFADLAALTVDGLPANVSGSFSPNPADASSTLTVTTSAAAPGTYPLTITGTAGSLTRAATATLVVTSENADFTLSASPSSRTVRQGRSTPYSVTVLPLNGFADMTTLSVSGLPPGGTATFSANPVAPNVKVTMRVFATSTTPLGTYTVTVTGTSGALVHSVNVTLQVTV